MPIVERQRPIPTKNEVLRPKEMIQVGGVIAHHLTDMVQSVVVQEGVYEKTVRLKQQKHKIADASPFIILII